MSSVSGLVNQNLKQNYLIDFILYQQDLNHVYTWNLSCSTYANRDLQTLYYPQSKNAEELAQKAVPVAGRLMVFSTVDVELLHVQPKTRKINNDTIIYKTDTSTQTLKL